VVDIVGHNHHWFPGKDGLVWMTILRCVEADTPPTAEAVVARLDGKIDIGYVQSLTNQWNEEDNRNLVYNTRQLKDIGILAYIRQIGRDLAAIEDPDQVTTLVGYAEAALSGALADKTDRDGSAKAVSNAAWNFNVELIPTGLGWFDNLAGGLWTKMITWIVAPYKGGKTTLMRNIALNACKAGRSVDVFAAEGSREKFALDCQVMLATELMIEREEKPQQLSSLKVMRSQVQPDVVRLTQAERKCLNDAKEIWDDLPIHVWDTADGITDLVTLRHRIRQSHMDHGSIAHFLDYSQLFGSGNTLFERQSQTAMALQAIAQKESVAVVVVAQQNEEAVKGRGSDRSGGVKGGGDAPATADFFLRPTLDTTLPSMNIMNLSLKFSRHTPTGSGVHSLNPSSGLITDRWIQLERKKVDELLDEL